MAGTCLDLGACGAPLKTAWILPPAKTKSDFIAQVLEPRPGAD
jgi:hypothetical protein